MKVFRFVALLFLLICCPISICCAGSLRTVALAGDTAPGTEGEFFLSVTGPVLNDFGNVAFYGYLAGGITDNSGIWSEGGGTGHALIAREGNQAPGTDAGVSFISLGTPAINSIGQTAFRSGLVGAGVDATNDRGIWSEKDGA